MKSFLPSLPGLLAVAAMLGVLAAVNHPLATAQVPRRILSAQPSVGDPAASPAGGAPAQSAPSAAQPASPGAPPAGAGNSTTPHTQQPARQPHRAPAQPAGSTVRLPPTTPTSGAPPSGNRPSTADPRLAAAPAGPAGGPNVPMLLASAVTQLDKQATISARIRQQVQLLGHQIVGTGSYEQTGSPDQRRFRLELKVPVGDGTGSFERIQTGKDLWISEDMPDRSSLTQVDVARVRQGLAFARGAQRVASGPSMAMPLEGLPKLVANLNEAVAWTGVRQGNLDQLAVWQLEGTWKPATLAQWVPDQRDKITAGAAVNWNALPAQLPDRVVLTLGHDDLFPYRIEYFRQPPPSKDYPAGSGSTLLATLEFFEVRFGGAIPPQRFVYQPGNRPFTVGTDDYLKQLGITDLPPASPGPQSQLPAATPQR